MNRRLLLSLCVLLTPTIARGDAEWIDNNDDGFLRTIRMEVTPADEPSPTFAHRLVLPPHQLVPGNSATEWLRAFPEETRAWDLWGERMRDDEFEKLYETGVPIGDLPIDELREHATVWQSMAENHFLPAARRRECDWGRRYEFLRGPETYTLLLPDVQASRSFARMLGVPTRLSIAEGRYDDTLEYLRTTYRLGRDVASDPLLVSGLVGIAITGLANGHAIDLIAAPDSPNLYWALAELPSPPISLRQAHRTEMTFVPRLFPPLENAEGARRSAEEWNAGWKQIARYLSPDDYVWLHSRDERDHIDAARDFLPMLVGITGYSHAKRRLVEWGDDAGEVERMPVGQVLMRYTARVVEIASGLYERALYVPYPRIDTVLREAEAHLDAARPLSDGPDRELLPFASQLLPATVAARRAEVRCAREVAALRVIEALRMHAARNGGELPRTLDDVSCVPVPENPATGKAFLYHRDGAIGVLELPSWEGFPRYSARYEITVAGE